MKVKIITDLASGLFSSLILFLLTISFLYIFKVNDFSVTPVTATGQCPNGWDVKEEYSPYTYNGTHCIYQVGIKSSTQCFVFTNSGNSCYRIDGINTKNLNVYKIGADSPSCQDISHVVFYYGTCPASTNTPTATKTPTRTPTQTPTNTVSPTKTPTRTPTATKTPTRSPSPTHTPYSTPTSTNSPTLTPTPQNCPSLSPTPTCGGCCPSFPHCPTKIPTQTPFMTPTNTPELQPTPTPTIEITNTPGESPTNTPGEGPTNTPGEGPTNTPGENPTNTPEPGPTNTPQPGPTNTPEPGPTETSGPNPTPTVTETPRPTGTSSEPGPTNTPGPVATATPTIVYGFGGGDEPGVTGSNDNPLIDSIRESYEGQILGVSTLPKSGNDPEGLVADKLPSGNSLIPGQKLIIPNLNLDLPVYLGQDLNGEMLLGHQEVLFTRLNGQPLYYSHNLIESFGRLWQLKTGDEIKISRQGELTGYRITQKSFVAADSLNAVSSQSRDTIYLVTCSLLDPNKRLVIQAKLQ